MADLQLDLPCPGAQDFLQSKHTCRNESNLRPMHRTLETSVSLHIEYNDTYFICIDCVMVFFTLFFNSKSLYMIRLLIFIIIILKIISTMTFDCLFVFKGACLLNSIFVKKTKSSVLCKIKEVHHQS